MEPSVRSVIQLRNISDIWIKTSNFETRCFCISGGILITKSVLSVKWLLLNRKYADHEFAENYMSGAVE